MHFELSNIKFLLSNLDLIKNRCGKEFNKEKYLLNYTFSIISEFSPWFDIKDVLKSLSIIGVINPKFENQLKSFVVNDVVDIIMLSIENALKKTQLELKNFGLDDRHIDSYLKIEDDKEKYNQYFELLKSHINSFSRNQKVKDIEHFKEIISSDYLSTLIKMPFVVFNNYSTLMAQVEREYVNILKKLIFDIKDNKNDIKTCNLKI
ncbi:MAG: hypothetical protein IKT40_09470 [Bacilli bacterium]|nr:hypothetical protein [Bacilli bacterium]